ARRAGCEFSGPFARQRLEMVFGGVGRTEAQRAGDFCPRGRKAGALDRQPDEIQDFLLAVGEFSGHGNDPKGGLYGYTAWILDERGRKCKRRAGGTAARFFARMWHGRASAQIRSREKPTRNKKRPVLPDGPCCGAAGVTA